MAHAKDAKSTGELSKLFASLGRALIWSATFCYKSLVWTLGYLGRLGINLRRSARWLTTEVEVGYGEVGSWKKGFLRILAYITLTIGVIIDIFASITWAFIKSIPQKKKPRK